MNRISLEMMLAAVAAFSLALSGTVTAANDAPAREWNFRVYLDDNEIGYHNFSLFEEAGQKRLVTEAEFRVKFLFITAYSYDHFNQETWQGDCLQEIRSRTDANGKKFTVHASRDEGVLEIEAPQGKSGVQGCVKTFAYWNPDILDEPRLLNSQTGELLPVEVTRIAKESLTVKGENTSAERYRLTAKDLKLDIWYSEDNRWLALESTVKGGRILRYELT